ncbi:buccalin-like isoform X1 [Tigriopus californicus]|uniref:buccalin-like isoform X1 n=1 Tax=Tigriopus californicus TaxID=6832 RepID=UPI0027DA1953|nr:buccalin-like isoform X1 [Tigriopus californicus]
MLKDDHAILTTSRVVFVILILFLESITVDSSGYIPNNEIYGSFPMDISLGDNEIQDEIELAKRGWNNFNAGYGKRGWNNFNGGSAKRAAGLDGSHELSNDILAHELGSNYGKRAWNSGFAGGMGKRAWNSGFQGGMGKRAWNSGFVGGIGKRYSPLSIDDKSSIIDFNKRAWNSGFAGGLGKRAWNSGFAGGMGKREWNSGFSGSLGKRALETFQDAGEGGEQDQRNPSKRNWSSLGIRGAWGKRSITPTQNYVVISPSNFRALQDKTEKRTYGWLALRGLWGKRAMPTTSAVNSICLNHAIRFPFKCERYSRDIPKISVEEVDRLTNGMIK